MRIRSSRAGLGAVLVFLACSGADPEGSTSSAPLGPSATATAPAAGVSPVAPVPPTPSPRDRITAACAAVDRPVEPFEPLLARFEPRLATRLAVSSETMWTYLAVETTAQGAEAEAALASLLTDVGVAPEHIALVGTLLEAYGHPAFSVALEASEGPPRVHLVWDAKGDAVAAGDFAGRVGAGGSLEAILRLARTLLVGDLEQLGVILEPGAAPRFETTYRWTVYEDMRATFASRLVEAGHELGVASAATEFQGSMLSALAPMAVRDLRLTTSFTAAGLEPRLAVGFPAVPHRLVLRFMSHTGPEETNERRMAGLEAALGADPEFSRWVTLDAFKREVPRVRFLLEAYDDGPASP